MDSRDEHKLTDRLHEDALARRLGKALENLSTVDAGQCPDAEIIAAYQERALDPVETGRWESHFGECSRCRKILAALAASAEAPSAENEGMRRGEAVAFAIPSSQSVSSPKLTPIREGARDWRSRWLAPALGVAAVLAVWFAMGPSWRNGHVEPLGTLIAQAPKSEVPSPIELQNLDRFSTSEAKKREGPDAASASAPSPPVYVLKALPATPAEQTGSRKELRDRNTDEFSSNASLAASPSQDQKQKKDRNELDAEPASAAAAPAPQPQARVSGAARESAEAPRADSRTAVVSGESSQISAPQSAPTDRVEPKTALSQPLSGQQVANRSIDSMAKVTRAPAGAIVVRAPSGTPLWRAGTGGSIERSGDAGVSWDAQESPLKEDLLAGSAPSGAICWLVGRNGTIMRTTDGQHWEKLAPPASSADASGRFPDWTGVTARNGEAAFVTAGDGRRYATQDGGKAWQEQ
jgi:hypothetical protein